MPGAGAQEAARLISLFLGDLCVVARLRTTLEQDGFELLAELGVDLAQGFHVGRPRPLAEV